MCIMIFTCLIIESIAAIKTIKFTEINYKGKPFNKPLYYARINLYNLGMCYVIGGQFQ